MVGCEIGSVVGCCERNVSFDLIDRKLKIASGEFQRSVFFLFMKLTLFGE